MCRVNVLYIVMSSQDENFILLSCYLVSISGLKIS